LCVFLKWWPPKDKAPSLSLSFDAFNFFPTKKGAHDVEHKPAAGHLQWINGEWQCQDPGALLPYPWRERAKPLEGRAADHFDCCVVRLWLCFVSLSEFSYNTGSKTILAKLKWLNLQAHRPKFAPKHPKY
jgi:hypothetical protein